MNRPLWRWWLWRLFLWLHFKAKWAWVDRGLSWAGLPEWFGYTPGNDAHFAEGNDPW